MIAEFTDDCEQGDTVTYTADEGERPSEAVVVALRVATGHADSEAVGVIDPLYDSIDPDALDAFFRSLDDDAPVGRVTFTHCGYEVTVTAGGEVVVTCE